MLTVKSRTSGQPLLAKRVKESSCRKFFGLPYILMMVLGSNLKGKVWRLNWYKEEDITKAN